jgi:hypothetical protein
METELPNAILVVTQSGNGHFPEEAARIVTSWRFAPTFARICMRSASLAAVSRRFEASFHAPHDSSVSHARGSFHAVACRVCVWHGAAAPRRYVSGVNSAGPDFVPPSTLGSQVLSVKRSSPVTRFGTSQRTATKCEQWPHRTACIFAYFPSSFLTCPLRAARWRLRRRACGQCDVRRGVPFPACLCRSTLCRASWRHH